MKNLPLLKPGDCVEIIAPASRCPDDQLANLIHLLESWDLTCLVAENIFAKDLFCANIDSVRFEHLKKALYNPDSKAVICARGGYGSMRLIPELSQLEPPNKSKIFVGMSDTTALQLFFQEKWQWPSIHGSLSPDRFSLESIGRMKVLLFQDGPILFQNLILANERAKEDNIIEGEMTGGNLCLIQASIGTPWALNPKDKIILIEEIGERGYRIDRMFEHLKQSQLFSGAKAIILGDFLGGLEPDGTSLIEATLERFAKACPIPVVQIKGIGHDYCNFPIPLGTWSTLKLGNSPYLCCQR